MSRTQGIQTRLGTRRRRRPALVDPIPELDRGVIEQIANSVPFRALYSLAANPNVQNLAQMAASIGLADYMGMPAANLVMSLSTAVARTLWRFAETGEKRVYREEAAHFLTDLMSRFLASGVMYAGGQALEYVSPAVGEFMVTSGINEAISSATQAVADFHTPLTRMAGRAAIGAAGNFLGKESTKDVLKMFAHRGVATLMNGYLEPKMTKLLLGKELKRAALGDVLRDREARQHVKMPMTRREQLTQLAVSGFSAVFLGTLALRPDLWTLFLNSTLLFLFGPSGTATVLSSLAIEPSLQKEIANITMGQILVAFYRNIKSNLQRVMQSQNTPASPDTEEEIESNATSIAFRRFQTFFTKCLSAFDVAVTAALQTRGLSADSTAEILFQMLNKRGVSRDMVEVFHQEGGQFASMVGSLVDPEIVDQEAPLHMPPSSTEKTQIHNTIHRFLSQDFQVPALTPQQESVITSLGFETPNTLQASRTLEQYTMASERIATLKSQGYDINTSSAILDPDVMKTLMVMTQLEKNIHRVDKVKMKQLLEAFSLQKKDILSSERGWQIFMACVNSLLV